jgi:peptidoglycan/LPS O-acetylase OafA/YrhL
VSDQSKTQKPVHSVTYRPDIDALRGLSVLIVVVFHAFPKLMPGGYIGVDLFFVISGFLITSILLNEMSSRRFSFLKFYERRCRRLLPALLTVFIFAVVFGYFVLFPDEYRQLGRHIHKASFFIQNFNLISEAGYFDVESQYKPMLHLWSLSIEEQYYFIWPVLLLIVFRVGIKPTVAILLLCLFSFFTNIYFSVKHPDTVFFHSATRFWELGMGSFLAILLHNGKLPDFSSRMRIMLLVLAVAVILFATFYLDEDRVYPFYYALLPTLAAMLIIISNVQVKSYLGLRHVGLISYPLYLWHWVLLSFLAIYTADIMHAGLTISVIVLSFFLAFLTYRYIEKLRYTRSHFVTFALVSVALVFAVGGRYIDKGKGLPERSTMAYLNDYETALLRTPASDATCREYVAEFIGEESSFHYCRFEGVNEEKLVAVVGDSHAHTLYPGIENVAREMGYGTILVANTSCPPFQSFEWGGNAAEIKQCQANIEQILSYLQQDEKIKKVFLTTRGPVYIHGEVERPFSLETVRQNLEIYRDEQRLNYQALTYGMVKTLERIAENKSIDEMFYLTENPEMNESPKSIIPRPFDVWGLHENPGEVARELHEQRMSKYKASIAAANKMYPDIKIIEVDNYFCDANACFLSDGNNSLYNDMNHISVYGALSLAEKLSPLLFSGASK